KFTTKLFDPTIAGRLPERLSRQMSKSGGSAETAHTALLVRPRGVPVSSTVVTMVTPVGKEPSTARNRSRSIDTCLLDLGWRCRRHAGHADGRDALHARRAVGRALAGPRTLPSGRVAAVGEALRVRGAGHALRVRIHARGARRGGRRRDRRL